MVVELVSLWVCLVGVMVGLPRWRSGGVCSEQRSLVGWCVVESGVLGLGPFRMVVFGVLGRGPFRNGAGVGHKEWVVGFSRVVLLGCVWLAGAMLEGGGWSLLGVCGRCAVRGCCSMRVAGSGACCGGAGAWAVHLGGACRWCVLFCGVWVWCVGCRAVGRVAGVLAGLFGTQHGRAAFAGGAEVVWGLLAVRLAGGGRRLAGRMFLPPCVCTGFFLRLWSIIIMII